MPHRVKKKFIDKKKAVTFQLVHRSQKDPLAADDEAPQRVLVPLGESGENEIFQETAQQREKRLSRQKLFGVGFEDDYDYMQHLKVPEQQQAILVPKSGRVTLQDLPHDESEVDMDEMTEVLKDGGHSAAIKLPSVVFASKEEEDTGMLHRAIPPIGPLVDWDPDVVAALDEDFDLDDPENILEDDFVVKASDLVPQEDYDEECEEMEDEGNSDICSWGSEENDFPEEETRSRFTQYSMTSSVIPRNEHLTLLDDQFEKFYETYDDEKIGDLGQVEIDGAVPVDNIAQQDALKMLLGIKDDEPDEEKSKDIEPEGEEEDEASSSEDEEEGDDILVELVKEEPKEKWDCESILSTYSNIYNHPKLIEDPPKPIKLSKKTGIPLDALPTRGLTKRQLQILDEENQLSDEASRMHTISESSNVTSVTSNVRRKDETKEEKAARKRTVREMRKERRAEKKATKKAFREEKARQSKELINIQRNLTGIRIS